jgi:hypothetical protein
LVKAIAQHVRETVAPLVAHIKELEAQPRMSYEGTWEDGRAYTRGSFVTHQGGLCHCEDTKSACGLARGRPHGDWR